VRPYCESTHRRRRIGTAGTGSATSSSTRRQAGCARRIPSSPLYKGRKSLRSRPTKRARESQDVRRKDHCSYMPARAIVGGASGCLIPPIVRRAFFVRIGPPSQRLRRVWRVRRPLWAEDATNSASGSDGPKRCILVLSVMMSFSISSRTSILYSPYLPKFFTGVQLERTSPLGLEGLHHRMRLERRDNGQC
jgi:hypothetical protein